MEKKNLYNSYAELEASVQRSKMSDDLKKLTLDITKREAKRRKMTLDEYVRSIPNVFESKT